MMAKQKETNSLTKLSYSNTPGKKRSSQTILIPINKEMIIIKNYKKPNKSTKFKGFILSFGTNNLIRTYIYRLDQRLI